MMGYGSNAPMPVLAIDATDAVFDEAVTRDAGIADRQGRQATAAMRAARIAGRADHRIDLSGFVDQVWAFFVGRSTAREQLRAAVQAEAVMRALAALPFEHKVALSPNAIASLGLQPMSGDAMQPALAKLRHKALSTNAALVWFRDAWDQAQTAAKEQQRAAVEGQLAATRAAYPTTLLNDLRGRGVRLAFQDGLLTVPAGTVLSAADRALIIDYRVELVALLASQAAVIVVA